MQDRLVIEQVTLLCRLALAPLIGTVFIAGLLCWILLEESSPQVVWSWYAAVVGTAFVRAAVGRMFLARKRTLREAIIARRGMLAAAAVSGVCWSLPLLAPG